MRSGLDHPVLGVYLCLVPLWLCVVEQEAEARFGELATQLELRGIER